MAFNKHPGLTRVKALIAGESGTGKSGLLATLANAGYRLFIWDFDDGLDILHDYLTDDGKKNTYYKTFPHGDPKSIDDAVKLMADFEGQGNIYGWGMDTVAVIDTATFMGKAALAKAATKGAKDMRQEYGKAIEYIMPILDPFTGPLVKCNVIFNTHLRYLEDDRGVQKCYPNILGQSLTSHIGGYFNNLWRIDVKPGVEAKRIIRTKADSLMALKCSAPSKVQAEEEFDLNKLFSKILSK